MIKPDSKEQVVFIEYHNGRPFTVITDHGNYDIEMCGGENGTLYCYNSGSGAYKKLIAVSPLCEPEPVTSAMWFADGYGPGKYSRRDSLKPVTKEELLKMGYAWLDKPADITQFLSEYDRKKGETTCNPFDVADEIYEGFAYCQICDEHMIDSPEHYCRHLFWSREHGMLMGCGGTECKPEVHKDSFFKVLNKTRLASQIAAAIRSGDYRTRYSGDIFGPDRYECYLNGHDYGKRFTDRLSHKQMEAMTDGVGWLDSLQPGKTEEAEQLTLEWIKEWEQSKQLQRKAG